ncbi:MAG: pyruvate, phosphate dikinase/phosphoenolpyruvate synthase regulator [Candidatus Zixiibacteriota bacterium]
MTKSKTIIIVSDGTGRTAKRLLDAVLSQYDDQKIAFSLKTTYQNITSKKQIDGIVGEITDEYLVVYSLISIELGEYFHEVLEARGVLHLNVLRPMIKTLSKFLGVHPQYRPGLLQIIDDNYYRKLDAIGYTVEHDDGRGHRIEEADIVLVGLSRTCKTPISMYLACNFGLKVVNIPIIAEDVYRKQLLNRTAKANAQRVVGLSIEANELARVREERAALLMGSKDERQAIMPYHDIVQVRSELRFCRMLYAEQSWEVIDVTRRAIEEISAEILERLKIKVDSGVEP